MKTNKTSEINNSYNTFIDEIVLLLKEVQKKQSLIIKKSNIYVCITSQDEKEWMSEKLTQILNNQTNSNYNW